MIHALCPECRYDLSGHAPDSGVHRCPECGRTCTQREAGDAAAWHRERGAAFAREAIIGATVGVVACAGGVFFVWPMSMRAIATLLIAGWAGSILVGTSGCVALARRRTRTWLPLALLLTLVWLAASHAVVGFIIGVTLGAR